MQKPRHPPHGRASAAEQRWVTTTSEELAFCCCCSRSIPPGIPASCLLVLPGRPDSRWSASQNTRAPVAWRKSSDRAVIARFFHRPITPIPGRRLNHRAASPEKIGGTSVSLPRSVPAGRPISNAPAVAGAFSSSARPQPMRVASPAMSIMAPIITAPCAAAVEPATSSIMPRNQQAPAETAWRCAERTLARRRTVSGIVTIYIPRAVPSF